MPLDYLVADGNIDKPQDECVKTEVSVDTSDPEDVLFLHKGGSGKLFAVIACIW